MKVPLHLKRRGEVHSADAFLLSAATFAPVAKLLAHLPGAKVHPVRGGFLVLPQERSERSVGGVIRLQRIGGDLFIPTSGILAPSLLPDEIAALTGERGLIVLPDRSILEFDPRSPLPVSRWLAAPVRLETWQSFPEPPPARNA